uniref:E3 ubiquitin-protein ligase Topors n=1 Tax=Phallusia mammillata TaxID=59560 RepID=A0A6F9DVY0_9ASCI|nr:E3 ubiquitin-protein ligase Topors-like [Phallusia mammillata]
MESTKSPGSGPKANNNEKTPEKLSSDTSDSDRCPICLAPPDNKALTNACFHAFCFSCLKEWSKVKAECPLCKTPFRSIIYNIKDNDNYDQFDVPETRQQFVETLHQRFTASVTEMMIANSFNEFRQHVRARQENNRAALIASTDVDVIRQRRWYYRNGQRISNVNNNKQTRDISSKFYRRNRPQLHRLIPWLRRELIVLFGANNMFIVNRIRDLIISCVTTCGITSEEFYDEIQPYLQHLTDQFINEFLSFARSPHDISSYDQNVRYSASDESEPSQRVVRQQREHRNPFVWNDALLPIDPPLATHRSYKPKKKRRPRIRKEPRVSAPKEVIEISSSSDTNCQQNISVEPANGESSDDVMFISYEKPPSQRTPDAYVTISSNDEDEPGPSGLSNPTTSLPHQSTVSSSCESTSSEFEPTVKSVIVPVEQPSGASNGKLCKVKVPKYSSHDPFKSRRRSLKRIQHHFSHHNTSSSDICSSSDESHSHHRRRPQKVRRRSRKHSRGIL